MKITDFDSFNDITGVDFYSLQFGDLANTVQTTEFGKKMRVCLAPNFDFLDTAAIMKQLDLVIAVDTSSAHLSAGLGVPTLLLSRFDQCWRWSHVQGITTSPWYPNSLKIYRQSVIGSWKEPLSAVKADLIRVAKYPKTVKKLVEFKEEEWTEIKKKYS
jgi:ADP-heptose:LPS heptosyltransferase